MCNEHDLLESYLRDRGEDFLREFGLDQVNAQFAELARAVASGHKAFRAAERREALGLVSPGEGADESEVVTGEDEFEHARGAANGAQVALRRARGRPKWNEAIEFSTQRPENLRSALRSARKRWITAIARADISAAEAREMRQMWDEVQGIALNEGPDALFSRLDAWFNEMSQILTAERGWGADQHSPLEWWQWLIIIGIIGLAVAALIACLWWAGCAWIKVIFVGVCLAGTAAGGVAATVCAGARF